MTVPQRRPMRTVTGWTMVAGAVLASWLAGALIVRTGLDWGDTFPHGPASEWRYLAVAAIALTVAYSGTATSILVFVSRRRRLNTRCTALIVIGAGMAAIGVLALLWRLL